MKIIDGPLGPFAVPSEPDTTRRICENIARDVWAGEYRHDALPTNVGRIIDIGAGWGAFAVWALSQWPGATIDCYEPHGAACDYLRRNAPTAHAHEAAVTVQETAVLSVGVHDNLDNWGALTVVGTTAGTTVATVHPRDLPPCDVLKIDAEMVEPEILENYQHLDGVKAVLYEFHTAEHRARLRAFCTKAGFVCLREVQVGAHSADIQWGPSIWVRPIPKILHQVWIGPLPPPAEMIDTWRRAHPDWEHRLWTNEKGWENQAAIDAMPEWNGKADIMRYEILAKHGGVALDADSICVRKLSESLLQHEAFACYENEIARPGLIACGAMGGVPGAPIWKACIEACKIADTTQPAWFCVGPGLLTRVASTVHGLHVLPARSFIPRHFSGVDAPGNATIYAAQKWGSTVGYDKFREVTVGPLVSVVIPCFRQAKYLGDAIRSVQTQTYKNWEIVVVAGDDESAAEAWKYASEKIDVVRDGGRGLANARNLGIGHARGTYVLPLDADDMLAPTFLSRTVPLSAPDTIVGTHLRLFGRRDGVVKLEKSYDPNDPKTLLDANPAFVCSLFSKKIWEDVGGYNVAPFGYEDWDFWISCCERGAKISVVPEPLFRYRIHGANDSSFCMEHDVELRAMIRLLHPKISTSTEQDALVVREMSDAVRVRMMRRLEWFPNNETLREWLGAR